MKFVVKLFSILIHRRASPRRHSSYHHRWQNHLFPNKQANKGRREWIVFTIGFRVSAYSSDLLLFFLLRVLSVSGQVRWDMRENGYFSVRWRFFSLYNWYSGPAYHICHPTPSWVFQFSLTLSHLFVCSLFRTASMLVLVDAASWN